MSPRKTGRADARFSFFRLLMHATETDNEACIVKLIAAASHHSAISVAKHPGCTCLKFFTGRYIDLCSILRPGTAGRCRAPMDSRKWRDEMRNKRAAKLPRKRKASATSFENFDGFITPEGELIAIDDVEGMLAFFAGRAENRCEVIEALESLAYECAAEGRVATACSYFEKILDLVDSPEGTAWSLLAMGQMLERSGEHRAALEAYSRAFELPPGHDLVWYYLNNNLGYCLNWFGRYQEAEAYCRAAIEIDPDRFNAHKNLGIALAGQGRHAEAARSLMVAARACPEDGRALDRLGQLLAEHPEIVEQDPDLALELEPFCRALQSGRAFPRVQ